MMNNIGRYELEKMHAEGWQFPGVGVRVANGWVVMATNPQGNFEAVVLADPDDEPEKWPEDEVKPQRQVE